LGETALDIEANAISLIRAPEEDTSIFMIRQLKILW